MGRWDAHGKFFLRPPGVQEIDSEIDLYSAWRTPWKRLQIAAIMPFVLNGRAAQNANAVGGGPGDLNVALRVDALEPAQWKNFPLGVAILGGVTLPTGKSIESQSGALGEGATGEGTADGTMGIALTHITHEWIFDAILLATLHAPRSIQNIPSTRAPGLLATGAATYVFSGGAAVGSMLTYRVEWDTTVGGQTEKDSSRRSFRIGFYGLFPIDRRGRWRAAASLTIDPPISALGQNELAGVSLLAGLQRGFE